MGMQLAGNIVRCVSSHQSTRKLLCYVTANRRCLIELKRLRQQAFRVIVVFRFRKNKLENSSGRGGKL